MLELMTSKPQASNAMLQEGAERQTLPSKTGFADMLKSSLSGEFRKPVTQSGMEGSESLTEAQANSPMLAKLLGEESVVTTDSLLNPNMDTLSLAAISTEMLEIPVVSEEAHELPVMSEEMFKTPGSITNAEDIRLASLVNQDNESTVNDSMQSTDQLVTPAVGSVETVITDSNLLTEASPIQPPLFDATERPQVAALVEDEMELNSSPDPIVTSGTIETELSRRAELPGSNPESDTLGLTQSVSQEDGSTAQVESSSDAERVEEVLKEASVLDEELVLGAGVIMPDKVAEKGLLSGNSERVGDRTAELRQEARAIKMAHAAEQSAQNSSAMSKGFSSDSQGQQNRDQSSPQQFMNTVQSVGQNAQTIRDMQIGQSFTSSLNERMTAQGSAPDERLNLSSGATERRAQLPVGLQSIGLPVSHQKWGQAMGQRVVYMANQQMQQAQITLNPEKLGPVQVRLHVDRDQQVHVVMTAQHGVTREAMDAAIPRLRDMFEQSGMNLGSVDVNDQNQFADGEQDEAGEQQSTASNNENLDEELVAEASNATTYETDNVVDYYA